MSTSPQILLNRRPPPYRQSRYCLTISLLTVRCRGATLVIKASGTLKKDIEAGAYVTVEVKYGYIKLIQKTIDLCENAGQVDLECPVKSGEMILTKEIDLPKAIPPVSALTIPNRQSFEADNFPGKIPCYG